MRYALMTEPQQGLTYDELLAIVRTAETAGFEAFFRSDHYASFPGDSGLPTTDAWATLGGLARETSTIRLGTLVSPVTFRIPGNLAKVIQTVDEMSDGRIEAGFGAGWNAEEHAQLGIGFPPIGERYDMLDEELAIIHGLWTEPDGWSFDGEHWQVPGRGPTRAGGARWPAPPAHHPRRQGRPTARGARGAYARRVQPPVGLAGRRPGRLRSHPRRMCRRSAEIPTSWCTRR